MCGVFGFAGRENETVNLTILRRIAAATSVRGTHAFGFAWIDSAGTLKMYKQRGNIADNLDLLTMAQDARMLIGHCRYTTQGSERDNGNNHPHAADGGWLVHNGMIPHFNEIILKHDLWMNSECDTEVLCRMFEKQTGSTLERTVKAVRKSVRSWPTVVLGLWKPGRMTVAVARNPLSTSTDERGCWLASLPNGLPGKAKPVKDNTAFSITKDGVGNPLHVRCDERLERDEVRRESGKAKKSGYGGRTADELSELGF